MALYGDVSGIGLGEMFGFLTANALQGVLSVSDPRGGSFRLYFREGRIFIPSSDHEGIQSLGRVVETDGVLSRAWAGMIRELRKRSDRFRRLGAEPDESRRRRYAEEVHDLLLLDEGRFEFRPGPLPSAVAHELDAGRGLSLEPQAIVMEVARRADERERVRRNIPSGRVVLTPAEGCAEEVARVLRGQGADLRRAPLDGNRPVEALLRAWGGSQLELLGSLASLVEGGRLVPLSGAETRARLAQLLSAGDLPLAAGLLGHLADVEEPELALRMALELTGSPAFRGSGEVSCTWSTDGLRAFALLRELLAQGSPCTLTLRHPGGLRQVALLPGVLSVLAQGHTEAPVLEQYLVQLGHMRAEDLRRSRGAEAPSSEGATRLGDRLGRVAVEQGLMEQFLDQLAEVALWRRCEVQLRNRGAIPRDQDAQVPVVSLSPALSRRLHEGLRGWEATLAQVPGLDAVFARGPKARSDDPAARFFARFSLARNLEELCRLAEAPRLQLVRLAAQGLKAGYLRRPGAAELGKWVAQARAQTNEIVAYRLVRAGVAFGMREQFLPLLGAYRGRDLLPRAEPALHGELEGVGLPALLQTLHEGRRTGSLSVTAAGRAERLYFQDGNAFLLRRAEDAAGQEFVHFFLGEGGEDGGPPAAASVQESELTEDELRDLKDRFLEVMFWEEARFSFAQNDLPEEFFSPPPGVTKLALHTARFLLETVHMMAEWDSIRRVIGGKEAVLEFASPDAQLAAVQAGECARSLTLVDGRLGFEDLLRASGEPRLQVGRTMAQLVETERLRVRREGAAV